MTKKKIVKIVIASVFILLVVIAWGLYVADVILIETPIMQNAFRLLVIVFICAVGLIRLFYKKGRKRRSLAFYQDLYAEHIKSAFENAPFQKKQLLRAIRLYDEDKLDNAIEILLELKAECKEREDIYAVGLFLALSLTDKKLADEAVAVYKQLIEMNATSSTVYGNLGYLYSGLGNYDDAIANLRLAIQNDEKNPAPYSNLAKLYFDTYDLENAKIYAHKSLHINHKFRQAASILAIIYSIEGDVSNSQKYAHIAIASGQNPTDLKNAVERYRAAKALDGAQPSESNTEEH